MIPSRRPPVDVELVIPAFNEALRLPRTLQAAVAFLARAPWSSRLVVVDNGSTDDTAAVARRLAPTGLVEVIGCTRPGKGAAVRCGVLTSTATWVGYADADLSTPIDTLTAALSHLERGAAAAIASRHVAGANLVVAQRPLRRVGGAAFRALTWRLLPGIHDTQCGFKVFRREVVQRALIQCRDSGFAFDVELLLRIRAAGGEIVEVPVRWTDDRASRLNPARDGLNAFRSVLGMRRVLR
ncbi:dolichyl-phosphate beta-glucosyltransferase [Micromonospora sp. B11E3]|uniref:dolichyl-phosphate beta-glucosyltransferase n=1 Tax=Micromonospora sp. B11E3 TaxID=3153562 RepID=UPI00325D19A3